MEEKKLRPDPDALLKEVEKEDIFINGVVLSVDNKTGKCTKIERVKR